MAQSTISVDTVYQTVLALCNKEQRGYITPQEFNLLARKAQMEIFESYFHDMKTSSAKMNDQNWQAPKKPFGETELIEEKLKRFLQQDTFNWNVGQGTSQWTLTSNIYYIKSVFVGGSTGDFAQGREVFEISNEEGAAIGAPDGGQVWSHPLLRPTESHFVYQIYHGGTTTGNVTIRIFPTPATNSPEYFNMHYYAKPDDPKWAYVVVNKRALYDSTNSVHFQLHDSEEQLLVSRIHQLAGVVIQKPGLVEVGAAEATSIKSQQND